MGGQGTEPPLGDSLRRICQLSTPSPWQGLILDLLLSELWQGCCAPSLPKPFLFN